MGLLDKVRVSAMALKWKGDGRDGGELKPEWYLAREADYKSPPPKTPTAVKAETESWLAELCGGVWEGLPAQSRFISGAAGLSVLLGEHRPHSHTNTDVVMIAQQSIVDAHVRAARVQDFHLMRRASGKTSSKSPVKYHFFYPITTDEALGLDKRVRRNPELTRIDPAANMISPEFTLRNHIKLYLHKDSPAGLICTEDKDTVIYPQKYFRGVPVTIGETRLYVIDPRYMWIKLSQVMKAREHNYLKHEPLFRRLEAFLRENRSEFPCPELLGAE